jgi:hypothetical protein
MFMALELDRSNLAQAVTDNLLKELKMNTNGILDLGAHQEISFRTYMLTVRRLQPWKYRLQAGIFVR